MTDTQTDDPFAGDANPFAAIGFEGGSPQSPAPAAPPAYPTTDPDDHVITVTRGPSSTAAQPVPDSSSGNPGPPSEDPFASGANPFQKIGFEPTTSSPNANPDQPVNPVMDVVKGSGAGLERGSIGMVGLPGDVQNSWDTIWDRAALGAVHKFSDWTGYGPQAGTKDRQDFDQAWNMMEPGGLSDQLQQKAGIPTMDSLPTSGQLTGAVESATGPIYNPKTTLGKGAETLAEFVPGAFAGPEGFAKKAATNVIAPAVASEAAGRATQGTSWEPYARMAGAVAGSGLTGAAIDGVNGAAARRAGAVLSISTENPQAALNAIEQGQAEAIPGVQPTTAELTGDPGLYRLQSQATEARPEVFQQRRAAQNEGRLSALDILNPGGDPDHVATAFQTLADDIGDRSQAAVGQHLASAQAHADELRGQGLPTDAYGSLLRDKIADAEADARAQERQLWSAVDPDNKLTNDTTGIKQAGASIYGDLPAADRAFMSPAETTFSNLIGGFKDVEPFRQVASLKSNLASAMRQELRDNGRTPAYARMSTLMGPVQDAINGTVTARVAQDAQAVAHGAMAPEDAMVARVKQWVQNHYANQQSQARLAEDSGYPRGPTASRSPANFISNRAEGAGNQRPGSASSDSGVSEAPVQPSFDPAAAERLSAANEATKARAETFGTKPISDVLAETGGRGNYKTAPSAVPGKLFKKGPGGFEAVDAFRNAVGNDDAAMHVLRDHALDDMRRTAMSPDGTLSPEKLAKWQADHADALRAFPELADKFRDAATATKTYMDASAQRRDLIKAYEKSEFGKLMNASHPDEVTGMIGALLKQPNRVGIFRRLTAAASRDPMALKGLRQAVLDHIVTKGVSDIETTSGPQRVIKSKAFADLVNSSKPALDEVLGKPSSDMLARIAKTLPRSSSTIKNLGVPADKDAAKYLTAAAKPHDSLLDRMVKGAFVARELAEHFGGEKGLLAAGAVGAGMVGKKLVGAIQASGARKVGDLITDAVLNPEQYAALMKQAPIRRDAGVESTLAFQLRRASMYGTNVMSSIANNAAKRAPRLVVPVRDEDQENRPHLALGGGLMGIGKGNGPLGVPSLFSGSTKKAAWGI